MYFLQPLQWLWKDSEDTAEWVWRLWPDASSISHRAVGSPISGSKYRTPNPVRLLVKVILSPCTSLTAMSIEMFTFQLRQCLTHTFPSQRADVHTERNTFYTRFAPPAHSASPHGGTFLCIMNESTRCNTKLDEAEFMRILLTFPLAFSHTHIHRLSCER